MLKRDKSMGKGIKMGEKTRKGEREKFLLPSKTFFTSTDGTFHALAPPREGESEEGDETERDIFFSDWNVLPSFAGIHKLRKNEVWFSSFT
jgi:hypothetical protein